MFLNLFHGIHDENGTFGKKKKKQQTTKTLPYIGEYFTFLRQKNLLIPVVESLFEQ